MGSALYDMSGNVWEWVEDYWHENYEGAPINGQSRGYEKSPSTSNNVVRGGSWYNSPVTLRVSRRNKYPFNYQSNFLGFRLVQDLEP